MRRAGPATSKHAHSTTAPSTVRRQPDEAPGPRDQLLPPPNRFRLLPPASDPAEASGEMQATTGAKQRQQHTRHSRATAGPSFQGLGANRTARHDRRPHVDRHTPRRMTYTMALTANNSARRQQQQRPAFQPSTPLSMRTSGAGAHTRKVQSRRQQHAAAAASRLSTTYAALHVHAQQRQWRSNALSVQP
jgi:hypothetical protein